MLKQARVASESRGNLLARLAMPLIGGFFMLSMMSQPPRAAELGPHDFIIPANDGYGTSECLSQHSACGQQIADAWCSAHGLTHALAYSRADDITGAVDATAKAETLPRDAVIVSCSN